MEFNAQPQIDQLQQLQNMSYNTNQQQFYQSQPYSQSRQMSFIQPSMNSFNQINAQFSLTDLNMNSANNANNNNFKQVKTQNSIQSPTKRKNNKDPGNRTYICGCGKTYGSNAALYTHIKNKHGGYQPENTIKPSNTDQSGKRGRPLQNIKKEGQFKKANGFVELDNIQERKMKIIYDKDSNQIFALFLEFGEQDEQKNPFEVIVTQKKGEGFLLSGLDLDRIKNIEQTYLKQLDIDQEQQEQIKKNKPYTDEHIYKTLQRFSQIWQKEEISEQLIRFVFFCYYNQEKSLDILQQQIEKSSYLKEQYQFYLIDNLNNKETSQIQKNEENCLNEELKNLQNNTNTNNLIEDQKQQEDKKQTDEKLKNQNQEEQDIDKDQKCEIQNIQNSVQKNENLFPYLKFCQTIINDFDTKIKELVCRIQAILDKTDEIEEDDFEMNQNFESDKNQENSYEELKNIIEKNQEENSQQKNKKNIDQIDQDQDQADQQNKEINSIQDTDNNIENQCIQKNQQQQDKQIIQSENQQNSNKQEQLQEQKFMQEETFNKELQEQQIISNKQDENKNQNDINVILSKENNVQHINSKENNQIDKNIQIQTNQKNGINDNELQEKCIEN